MTYFYHQSELIVWKKITKKLNLVRGLLSIKQQSLCRKFQSLEIKFRGLESYIWDIKVESLKTRQIKFEVFEDLKIFGVFRFWSRVTEPIRKDKNNGKLPVWSNTDLSYWSFFFETVTYVFCWKELLEFGLILLSGVTFQRFRRFHRMNLTVSIVAKTCRQSGKSILFSF